MKKRKTDQAKLELWQERLKSNGAAWAVQTGKMEHREALYRGCREMRPLVARDRKRDGEPMEAVHVRNIVFENIEAEISSTIPQPKVTPKRKEDEGLAQKIEDFLRNELDRMQFEEMNDQQERTVNIQGGGGFLVEWDNNQRSHKTVGELAVGLIHPKELVPQDGVYKSVRDMDYFILKLPQTKAYIKRRYGVDVSLEPESEPDIKGAGQETGTAEDLVTQYIGYYKNERGGIGLYSWVNDIELENLEDYQARRLPRCAKCGAVKPAPGQVMQFDPGDDALELAPEEETVLAPELAAALLAGEEGTPLARSLAFESQAALAASHQPREYEEGACPFCGAGEWEEGEEDFEEFYFPVTTAAGREIPGLRVETDETGAPYLAPTKVPFYKPDVFPLILQKNVSVYGQLLGNSDVDVIEDQQNTTNRMSKKIIDKLVKAGTRITLPDRADLRTDPEDGERWFLQNASDKAMIGTYDFTGNIEPDLAYLAEVYEEARQMLGITDSFQGRSDSTAQSGKAKQFAAAQSAGRLESKRVMKNAAYANLFEVMFKMWLAYADEPRPVVSTNSRGESEYGIISRYDFLEQDESGTWYWNDQFLFSVDTSSELATNRQSMWQEVRQDLQTGAYGDPSSLETLVIFWTKMESLHYPGAKATKQVMEERLRQQQEQQAAMMRLAQQKQTEAAAQAQAAQEAEAVRSTIQQAQQDAAEAAREGPA